MEHLEDGAGVYLQVVLSYEEPGREKCPGKSFPVSGVVAKWCFLLCTHRRRWWCPLLSSPQMVLFLGLRPRS